MAQAARAARPHASAAPAKDALGRDASRDRAGILNAARAGATKWLRSISTPVCAIGAATWPTSSLSPGHCLSPRLNDPAIGRKGRWPIPAQSGHRRNHHDCRRPDGPCPRASEPAPGPRGCSRTTLGDPFTTRSIHGRSVSSKLQIRPCVAGIRLFAWLMLLLVVNVFIKYGLLGRLVPSVHRRVSVAVVDIRVRRWPTLHGSVRLLLAVPSAGSSAPFRCGCPAGFWSGSRRASPSSGAAAPAVER